MQFDVLLNVDHTDHEVTLSLHYWPQCLSYEHAELLGHTAVQALTSLLDNLSGTVADVELFSEAHGTRLLSWAPETPVAIESCVQELVEEKSESQPDRQAISTTDLCMTYRELESLSSRLAGHLAYLGVGPNRMVPFCFDNSAWAVVVMYAILKSGGVCVALSPEYTDIQIASIIQSTGASVVVSHSEYVARFGKSTAQVITLDGTIESVSAMLNYLEQFPITTTTPAKPSNAAFVVLGSNLTSISDAIILEHSSISTGIHYRGTKELLSTQTRVLQFSVYTDKTSIHEIFATLAFGATVCIPSRHERLANLSTFVKSQVVNTAHLTPTVAYLLDPDEVSLRTLTLEGEPVPRNLVRLWANHTNLITSYEPAGCSTSCSGALLSASDIQDGTLGRPCGSLMWIVDSKNSNKLAPIGCPGEILIEGPLLARGYFDPRWTEEVFLVDPTWVRFGSVPGVERSRRLVKSGHIARYNMDGTLTSLGPKESQGETYSQQISLAEIEAQISDQFVGHSVALVPKNGHWLGKLVVLLSLERSLAVHDQPLAARMIKTSADHVHDLRKRLHTSLPGNLLPHALVPVTGLPVLSNGKLNREKLQLWVETLDADTCERVLALGQEEKQTNSKIENQLVTIWSKVLSLPEQMVDINQSFFRLGGDSIAAMHAAAQLQSETIPLAVHDILRLRTIAALAALAVEKGIDNSTEVPQQRLEIVPEAKNTDFPLTPIQGMHFQSQPNGLNHFNQSCLLRFGGSASRSFTPGEVKSALLALVERHSMLNARFSMNSAGIWSQRIIETSLESLNFSHSAHTPMEEARSIFSSVQDGLDIQNGPLIGAGLLDVTANGVTEQLLFIAVHHLAVDLVSWRILVDDLEALLLHQSLGPKPMSFQSWESVQSEHAKKELSPEKALPSSFAPSVDFTDYWGISKQPQTYGTTVKAQFTVDKDTTALLLGKANDALDTETVEILLALLLCSFGSTFSDRALPVVFSEGHGRETLLQDIDLSRTVGWFTTMFPISIRPTGRHHDKDSQIRHTLRSVRDYRRSLPGKGWPYFASRYLNDQGISTFAGHENMEILFNYLGTAGTATSDRLLEQLAIGDASDVSSSAVRSALFEVTSIVQHGQLCFQFLYDSDMPRQQEIQSWIHECESILTHAAKSLARAAPELREAEFPLLDLGEDVSLESVVQRYISRFGLSGPAEIESIHPCSPMQEGILLSQSRTSGVYDVQGVWKVAINSSESAVDVHQLKLAAQRVISRHDILRTYFAESHRDGTSFLQLVLKHVTSGVQLVDFNTLEDLKQVTAHEEASGKAPSLPYLVTICQVPNNDVYLRLDINHALIDGTSTALLIRDLGLAYNNQLSPIGPKYSDFIAHLQTLSQNEALTFWTEMLKETSPCHFPLLNERESADSQAFKTIEVELPDGQSNQLHDFCRQHDTTLANFMSTIWALVLSCFVGTDCNRVAFGYLASGRDVPIEGAHEILGPMITMIIRQAEIESQKTVLGLMETMQDEFARSWPHQHTSLGEIHHALGLKATPLFNTIVNVQRSTVGDTAATGDIFFVPEMGHDPSEVNNLPHHAFQCSSIMTIADLHVFSMKLP